MAVFCIYYVSRGILQENRQELVVFVLSIALVMLRSVINFTVLPAKQKPELLVSIPAGEPPSKLVMARRHPVSEDRGPPVGEVGFPLSKSPSPARLASS